MYTGDKRVSRPLFNTSIAVGIVPSVNGHGNGSVPIITVVVELYNTISFILYIILKFIIYA